VKVTILSLEYPPNVYGGVGRHVEHLVKHLRNFVDVEIRTMKIGANIKWIKEYEAWDIFDGSYPWDKVLRTMALNLNMVRDDFSGEIVHAHTWYMNFAGFLAKKLHKTKLVSTVHSLEPMRPWKREQLGRGYNLSVWMERIGLEESDGIIAVSNDMKNDIHNIYGIDESKIEVIYNGIDTDIYRKRKDNEFIGSLGLEDGYVLFVGRMTKQKGIEVILKASDLIDGKIVLVTGKADTLEDLKRYKRIIESKKNVVWINKYFTEDEMSIIYSHASVFVCPSIYEPFGIINLEALACEVPVVGSAVGGIKEIVQDDVNGFLVPPQNPKALADKVNLLLGDESLRKDMGKRGRHRAMEFSWEKIAEKTYQFYRRLLNE